jgi:CubicO group peptidase (beta-lactamase class C family)
VTKHLPGLAGMEVQLEDGARVPAESEMTMRQLVSHSAGFAYGLGPSSPVDTLYYDANISAVDQTTEHFLSTLADLPLAYQPGERWVYSIAVDVQGAVIERLSGQSFADFARERIFEPLGMDDTAFYVPAEKQDRLASIHRALGGALVPMESTFHFGKGPTEQPDFSSGGAGLYSTAPDYMTFTRMLLNGGEWNGARILSPESVALMHTNLLTGNINDGGTTAPGNGTGFGVDFGIITDPKAARDPRGAGTYYWGGAFGTFFWIDPANDLTAVGMIQRSGPLGPPDPDSPIPDPQIATRDAIYEALHAD